MAVNPKVHVFPTELNDIVSNTCIFRDLIKKKTQEHQTIIEVIAYYYVKWKRNFFTT